MLLLGSMTIEHAQCELFTALVHMEGLLNLEQELLHSLNAYINAEKLRWERRLMSSFFHVTVNIKFLKATHILIILL